MRRLLLALGLCASLSAHAAVTKVGQGAKLLSTASQTAHTDCPASVAGDLQIYVIEFDGTGSTVPSPSGWTQIAAVSTYHKVFGRISAGASDVNTAFATGTATPLGGQCIVWRGNVTTSVAAAIDVTATATASSQTILRMPAITPTGAGEVLLFFGSSRERWTSVTTHASFTRGDEAPNIGNGTAFVWDYWIQTTLTTMPTTTDLTITGDPASSTQAGITIAIKPAVGGGGGAIDITSVDGDNVVTSTQTGVVIAGVNFGASQGAGSVTLRQAACTRTLAVTSWGASSITVTMSLGTCLFGPGITNIRVTENGSTFAEQAVAVNPPAGTFYTNLSGGLAPLAFNKYGAPTRIYGKPLDLQSDSQIMWKSVTGTGACTVAINAAVTCDSGVTAFDYDFARAGNYFGTTATWQWRGLPPTFTGPKITH